MNNFYQLVRLVEGDEVDHERNYQYSMMGTRDYERRQDALSEIARVSNELERYFNSNNGHNRYNPNPSEIFPLMKQAVEAAYNVWGSFTIRAIYHGDDHPKSPKSDELWKLYNDLKTRVEQYQNWWAKYQKEGAKITNPARKNDAPYELYQKAWALRDKGDHHGADAVMSRWRQEQEAIPSHIPMPDDDAKRNISSAFEYVHWDLKRMHDIAEEIFKDDYDHLRGYHGKYPTTGINKLRTIAFPLPKHRIEW